jgi:hypothetical protein
LKGKKYCAKHIKDAKAKGCATEKGLVDPDQDAEEQASEEEGEEDEGGARERKGQSSSLVQKTAERGGAREGWKWVPVPRKTRIGTSSHPLLPFGHVGRKKF